MDTNLNPKHRRLFTLAAQLKAGKGLTVGATIVEGEFGCMYGESQAARLALKQVTYTPVISTLPVLCFGTVWCHPLVSLTWSVQVIEQESVKGFPEVVVGTNVSDCISHVIQVQSKLPEYTPTATILH